MAAGWNRLWLGRVMSFSMLWTLCRHLKSPISLMLCQWVPVIFVAVLITRCNCQSVLSGVCLWGSPVQYPIAECSIYAQSVQSVSQFHGWDCDKCRAEVHKQHSDVAVAVFKVCVYWVKGSGYGTCAHFDKEKWDVTVICERDLLAIKRMQLHLHHFFLITHSLMRKQCTSASYIRWNQEEMLLLQQKKYPLMFSHPFEPLFKPRKPWPTFIIPGHFKERGAR